MQTYPETSVNYRNWGQIWKIRKMGIKTFKARWLNTLWWRTWSVTAHKNWLEAYCCPIGNQRTILVNQKKNDLHVAPTYIVLSIHTGTGFDEKLHRIIISLRSGQQQCSVSVLRVSQRMQSTERVSINLWICSSMAQIQIVIKNQ